MRRILAAVLCVPLIAAVPASAPGQHYQRDNRSRQSFNRGAYEGGRGGNYYGQQRRYDDYDRRYHQGGIGPGKGALIGGAGGAALGALFTGSAKGAIVGGAAGAGIGALLGKQAQDNRRRR
jgi:hypothetical protein